MKIDGLREKRAKSRAVAGLARAAGRFHHHELHRVGIARKNTTGPLPVAAIVIAAAGHAMLGH
jgi:hypothetical protein